jgi:hypothetical protein
MKAIGAFVAICFGVAVIIGACALYQAMGSIPKPKPDVDPSRIPPIYIQIDKDGKAIEIPYIPNHVQPRPYYRPGSLGSQKGAKE